MQLTPDWSILYQIAIFVIVWLGLRYLVFEPTGEVLTDRRRRTIDAEHAADAMAQGALAERARYEEAIHQRRLHLAQEAEAARHAAIEESNRAIGAARAAIAQELATHRAAIAAQVDTARRSLGAEAARIADEMLLRVTEGVRP